MNKILTEYEKGWLEAFLDGEGSLSLTFSKQKTSPRPRIDIRMDFSNTNYEIIKKAQEICGGGCIVSFDPKDNRKKTFRLSCRSSIIRNILPQLNLIVKKKQQSLILEAAGLIEGFGKGSRKGFQGGKMRPLWKDKKFADIKKELNNLNKRGRIPSPYNLLIDTHIQDV